MVCILIGNRKVIKQLNIQGKKREITGKFEETGSRQTQLIKVRGWQVKAN